MNNTIQMYDAQADSIKVKDIAANVNNRTMLERMRRNNANDCNNETLYIIDSHDDDGEECIDYVPEGAYDMGWLGYFIGKSDHLGELNIRPFTPTSGDSVRDVMKPFFRGISRNKSIREVNFVQRGFIGGRDVYYVESVLREQPQPYQNYGQQL